MTSADDLLTAIANALRARNRKATIDRAIADPPHGYSREVIDQVHVEVMVTTARFKAAFDDYLADHARTASKEQLSLDIKIGDDT